MTTLDRTAIERIAPAASSKPFIIAYSGGGDSTALLHLLAEQVPRERAHALIVDHALRSGSAADAARAAEIAKAAGVAHTVLTLDWPQGVKRGQQAAREGRYRALCNTARRLGAETIVLAHTADDQAETVFMRAGAGSSWRGMAGMAAFAPAPVWPEGRGLTLARPLLHARRTELRDWLQARSAAWIEDPANANTAFERVRVRARLAEMQAEGVDPMRLAEMAARTRPQVDQLDRFAAALIADAVRFDDDVVVIECARWEGAPETRRRALSVLIAAAAGAQRAPAKAALERLEQRLCEANFRGASLGGARAARVGGVVRLSRDAGALAGRADGAAPIAPLELPANEEAVWDGRLALTAREAGWQVVPSDGEPVLRRDQSELAIEDAAVFAPRWLIADHVAHLLGAH